LRFSVFVDVNCVQKQVIWIADSADSRHQWRH